MTRLLLLTAWAAWALGCIIAAVLYLSDVVGA